jgi:acetyl esterase
MAKARPWDPEMRAARDRMDEMAAQHPPVTLEPPLDPQRRVNDALNLPWAEGGPVMAESSQRWVFGHGRRILCRLHRATPGTAPVLIWFHGGGWVWSSVDTHDRLVREYAAGAGVAAVNVDYALSPEAKFPQALLECAAAVRAIAAEGAGWGIDPSRIVLGGDSAGGNLALATALLLRDQGGPALRGVLTCYPVTDAACDTPSYAEFTEGYGLTRASMQAYWRLYLRHASDGMNPLASPLRAELGGLPPTLIQVAELDVLRDDGATLAQRMRDAGVDVTLEEYPGVLHGFMRLSSCVSKSRAAIESASAWLKRVSA